MKKYEISRCPFCGAPAEIITKQGTSFYNIKIKCSNCSAEMSKLFDLSIEEEKIAEEKDAIVNRWNTRA